MIRFNRKKWVKISHNNVVEFLDGLEKELYLLGYEDYPEDLLQRIIDTIECAENFADLELFHKSIEENGLELV